MKDRMETKSRIHKEDDESNFSESAESSAVELGIELDDLRKSSRRFIGKWNNLVSTTNWEKGVIITQWRQSLIDSGSPASKYSDEAWAQLVGGVTSQHVGRLRRVHQRFGQTYKEYKGLYWTHFHAATEWNDAEMWLEGAVQNKWSVSQMRNQRWETMGKIESDRPLERDIVISELDEDFEPANAEKPHTEEVVGKFGDIKPGPRFDGPDFGDEDVSAAKGKSKKGAEKIAAEAAEKIDFVRPFEKIAELPEDLADAFESFKLAILRHKADGWQEISCEDVLAGLDALKQLATAP